MILLGLTGGIGMGKSTAAAYLQQRQLKVIDTDLLARELVQRGQPALQEIRDAFGDEIVGRDGELRRDIMARRVFSDPTRRRQLEAILHPRIRERWTVTAQGWAAAGVSLGVVVIPLLFETGAAHHFQATICVACSPGTQLARLRPRGWSDDEIARRNSAQWPVEKKMQASTFVVWSEGTPGVHFQQLERILHTLGF
jgi:dephospho-CoA kinase